MATHFTNNGERVDIILGDGTHYNCSDKDTAINLLLDLFKEEEINSEELVSMKNTILIAPNLPWLKAKGKYTLMNIKILPNGTTKSSKVSFI